MLTLYLLAAIAAGVLIRSRLAYLGLPELRTSAAQRFEDVTVIIPARNEAANIARVVRSFAGVPVIVVDDDSSDSTAHIAKAAGARVISAPPLTAGAMGKPAACLAGAQAARSEWLLFVDADTWYAPEFLPALLAEARRQQVDMASVFLRQHCVTPAEQILLPYAFALYFCGVTAARAQSTLANGQCLLFRREAYERIGGHGAVMGSVIEDMALALAARRAGLRAAVLRGESLGSVRMYDSLAAIWRGFQKNSFRFLVADPVSGIPVVAASVLLTSWLPALGALAMAGQWWTATLIAVLPSLLLRPWYATTRAALAAPAAIYLFQAIALSGMFGTLARRPVRWKGRPV